MRRLIDWQDTQRFIKAWNGNWLGDLLSPEQMVYVRTAS